MPNTCDLFTLPDQGILRHRTSKICVYFFNWFLIYELGHALLNIKNKTRHNSELKITFKSVVNQKKGLHFANALIYRIIFINVTGFSNTQQYKNRITIEKL